MTTKEPLSKENQALLKELTKVRVPSHQVQMPVAGRRQYTNLDVEGFNDAIDTHVEKQFHDGVDRQKRQQEAAHYASTMTADQRQRYNREVAKAEEQYMRADIKSAIWKTDDFAVVKTLGQGGFGVVRLVQHKDTKEVFAMKQMSQSAFPKKNDLKRLMAERKCFVALQDNQMAQEKEYFVQLHACFIDNSHLYMIMEFLQGGDLISVLQERKRLSETETRFYIAQLIEALDYIHRMGFVHRDIKPDNICFTKQGHLKLLDFGLCKETTDAYKIPLDTLEKLPNQKVMKDDNNTEITVGQYTDRLQQELRKNLNSWVGTPQYMAPEIILREGYTKSVDFWAAGIVMFDCLNGSTPFHPRVGPEDPVQLQKQEPVNVVIYKVKNWSHYFGKAVRRGRDNGLLRSESLDLLNQLVCDKNHRASVDRIRAHKFFGNLRFDRLLTMQPPIVPRVTSSLDTSRFPNIKEVPIPKWQKMNMTMERIRYEAFDFTRAAKPDMKKLAKDAKGARPMPTLLENNNHHIGALLQDKGVVNKPTAQYNTYLRR